ncbi:MAG: hypothetical protein AAF799_28715 [Myxococcota bacterium]
MPSSTSLDFLIKLLPGDDNPLPNGGTLEMTPTWAGDQRAPISIPPNTELIQAPRYTLPAAGQSVNYKLRSSGLRVFEFQPVVSCDDGVNVLVSFETRGVPPNSPAEVLSAVSNFDWKVVYAAILEDDKIVVTLVLHQVLKSTSDVHPHNPFVRVPFVGTTQPEDQIIVIPTPPE